MKTATFNQYILNFKQPSGTSRGVLNTKETYFIEIFEDDKKGIGECALFRGLSFDDDDDYEEALDWACKNINLSLEELQEELINHPSIIFGIEQALANLNQEKDIYFPSDFTDGKDSIKINGLIWMGDFDHMLSQIEKKMEAGFRCVKLKIGAIDFEKELALLRHIRTHFSSKEIELRVDANGAFSPGDAMEKLKRLSEFDLHSIEQPIRAGQWEEMARLTSESPLPIALDEELITEFSALIKAHPGNAELYFHVMDEDGQMYVNLMSRTMKISVQKEIMTYLKSQPQLSYKIN